MSYVPQEILNSRDKEDKDESYNLALINQRNIELLQRLRTLDSAFSLGESGKEFMRKYHVYFAPSNNRHSKYNVLTLLEKITVYHIVPL